MPIQRFRSLDEMRRALWRRGSDQLLERIRRLWLRSWQISPRVYPQGVFKYRTIEDAQRARQCLSIENRP